GAHRAHLRTCRTPHLRLRPGQYRRNLRRDARPLRGRGRRADPARRGTHRGARHPLHHRDFRRRGGGTPPRLGPRGRPGIKSRDGSATPTEGPLNVRPRALAALAFAAASSVSAQTFPDSVYTPLWNYNGTWKVSIPGKPTD